MLGLYGHCRSGGHRGDGFPCPGGTYDRCDPVDGRGGEPVRHQRRWWSYGHAGDGRPRRGAGRHEEPGVGASDPGCGPRGHRPTRHDDPSTRTRTETTSGATRTSRTLPGSSRTKTRGRAWRTPKRSRAPTTCSCRTRRSTTPLRSSRVETGSTSIIPAPATRTAIRS